MKIVLSLLIGIVVAVFGVLVAGVVTFGLDYLNILFPPHGGAILAMVFMVLTLTCISYRCLTEGKNAE